MKNLLTISIIITSIISSSFGFNSNKENLQKELNKINSTTISDFTNSYKGTINNKYEIVMTLTKTASYLSGTYYYKSQGTSIKISGTIDKNGILTINEFNDTGKMTGIFKGQLTHDNIVGHWSKPDGSKTMPFSISKISNNETIISRKKESDSDWTGTYFDKFGRLLKITGPAKDGALQFELTPQNSASCQEDTWKGTAYLTATSVANYMDKGSECHFNFTFNPGQIELQEYDCSHGAACGTFDGFYTQKK